MVGVVVQPGVKLRRAPSMKESAGPSST
jgi:hypothetical protein